MPNMKKLNIMVIEISQKRTNFKVLPSDILLAQDLTGNCCVDMYIFIIYFVQYLN